MERDAWECLQRGDIIQHVGSGESYVVLNADGKQVFAIREMIAMNPTEWESVGVLVRTDRP